MKKNILILFLLISLGCFSQAITVNSITYTTEQLINDVLINSPCVFGKNFNSKTGTDFGSSNGIGYFENTNPNFPFKRGVVLTTGDINKVPGPNSTILRDGNSSWSGDSDLENNLLSQSGIQMKSINASYIEFDFNPKSPNFDFSFLFASEEYGTAQCNFSDAFAFLLQDVTIGEPSKNLAVVPNTNFPISVETIRDGANNSECPSANLAYFGSFNGDGFGPAINFNGQTVRMVASAKGLDINHTYRIKLVIADGGNNTEYDSAIFIEGNSFNIGQNVLGLDYTSENNKALCLSDSLPILSASGLKPNTTFIWQKDGISFSPEQTGNELNLNLVDPNLTSGMHTYSVIYSEPSCKGITDSILVEIYPKVEVMDTVPDLYSCELLVDVINFDLNKQTNAIKAATNLGTSVEISYHLTESNAKLNLEPLSTLYSITKIEDGKTIYTRITDQTNKCYEIRSFKLINSDLKFQAIPDPETLCARAFNESPLKASFNLSDQKSILLGNLSPEIYKISFFKSESDAISNIKSIPTISGNAILQTQTIWARLQIISNPDCFVITNFELIVKPIPDVDKLEDVFVCDYYVLPELEVEGAQYWTKPNGEGDQLFAGDIISKKSTIYIYNFLDGCPNQSSFRVIIIKLDNITPSSATYCNEYTLPQLPYGKYFTLSGGIYTAGNVELLPGTSITSIGLNKMYVWYEDLTQTPTCIKEKLFEITIIQWEELPEYKDQFDCYSYTLPLDPNGGVYYSGPKKGLPILEPGTVITTTKNIYVYKEKENSVNEFNCTSQKKFTVHIGKDLIAMPNSFETCSSYELPVLSLGEYRTESDGGGVLIDAGTVIDVTTQIWFYIKGQSCTNKLNFTIKITREVQEKIPDVTQCNIYYLPTMTENGDFYSGPSGTGVLYKPGTPITESQSLYFYDKSYVSVCNFGRTFQINIIPSTLLDAKPVEVLRCGQSYILDDLKNGEYYEFPGGPSPTNPVLPPGFEIKSTKTIYAYAPEIPSLSCVSEYSITVSITLVNPIPDQFACTSYNLPNIVGIGDYYTEPNGPYGTGKKLSFPYETITASTKLYVYAENNNRVSCFDEKSFSITIYNIVVDPISPVKVCDSYSLPKPIAPAKRYFKKAGGPSPTNKELFPNDIISQTTTIYAYGEIGSSETVKCYDEKPFEITIIPKPKPELIIPTICVDSETSIVTNAEIYSGYDPTNYSFEWKKEDGTLLSINPDFSSNSIGNYTFEVKDISTTDGCVSEKYPFTLKYSSRPKEVTYIASEWFSNEQSVVINATPYPGYTDNFTYSLDGGVPQTSNVFRNLTTGTHEITISDGNICGNSRTITIEVNFPYFPKFFTPNQDGYNDTWTVTEFEELSNFKIYIFDRYGKLLKEMLTINETWDGNYMGKPLPSDDYWFSISYIEKNAPKVYKSHFSLIR